MPKWIRIDRELVNADHIVYLGAARDDRSYIMFSNNVNSRSYDESKRTIEVKLGVSDACSMEERIKELEESRQEIIGWLADSREKVRELREELRKVRAGQASSGLSIADDSGGGLSTPDGGFLSIFRKGKK